MGIREINSAGLTLIQSFEGLPDGDPTTVNIDPYLDPVGIATIGYGHAIVETTGLFVRDIQRAQALYPGGITRLQAVALLHADVLDTCRRITPLLTVTVTDNAFAALVSFAFNLGVGNLAKSTLLKYLNAGRFREAAAEFVKWNRAGGKVLAGLTRRREAEAALFVAA